MSAADRVGAARRASTGLPHSTATARAAAQAEENADPVVTLPSLKNTYQIGERR
jgi:hypothetical protein